MTDDFKKWLRSCESSLRDMANMQPYLNSAGKERYATFSTLVHIAAFCDNASEMVAMIDNEDNLSEDERTALKSAHATAPIRKLRKLAEIEASENAEPKTFYVTFKLNSRFVAQVMAKNPTEAIREATYRYEDADFGEAEEIDGEAIIVETEEGDIVWEK